LPFRKKVVDVLAFRLVLTKPLLPEQGADIRPAAAMALVNSAKVVPTPPCISSNVSVSHHAANLK